MGLLSYKVSAPGSLMLFGEHAVLYGKQAVVTAIDYRIKINLVPRLDRRIKIVSSGFTSYQSSLDRFKIAKPYEYVLTAIKLNLAKIKQGFTLNIQADFPSNLGFGSSAAVTVATIGVLKRWFGDRKPNLKNIYQEALLVVRLVQGLGSGADVAASVFGGVIGYQANPLKIKKLGNKLPLVALYSGHKVATYKVVNQVTNQHRKFPEVFTKLYEAIDVCAKAATKAIQNQDYKQLGALMNIHQGLHDALGVNTAILSKLVFELRKQPKIYGAKISGSGLGDCVIGLGKIKKILKNGFKIVISPRGIVYL